MKLVGKRIKAVRLKEKLTQTELGKILNVEKSAVCHYEKGERNIPIDVIIKIAQHFHVDANYLLGINHHGKSKDKEILLSSEEVEFILRLRKTSVYQEMIRNPKNYAKLVDMRLASYKVKM